MNILIIINDAPYGSEKAYNACRLAINLAKGSEQVQIRIFLLADAVSCALEKQTTPDGYYNIGRFLRSLLRRGANVYM